MYIAIVYKLGQHVATLSYLMKAHIKIIRSLFEHPWVYVRVSFIFINFNLKILLWPNARAFN